MTRKRKPALQKSVCAECGKSDDLTAYCPTCGNLTHDQCMSRHARICGTSGRLIGGKHGKVIPL